MRSKAEVFLEELRGRISYLPSAEVEKAMGYYSESLADKIEDGVEEDEAIRSFGTMDEIVKSIEEEVTVTAIVRDRVIEKSKKSNMNKWILAVILLLTSILWLPIVAVIISIIASIYIFILCLPIMLFVGLVSNVAFSATSIIIGFWQLVTLDISFGLVSIGRGFLSAGLSIIIAKPIFIFCKWFIRLHIRALVTIKKILLKR